MYVGTAQAHFEGVGIEVALNDSDTFLKIKETLTRIGIESKKDKTLYQSCHILHRRGRYAIVHFKELFKLDGMCDNVEENDIARRNRIVKLLTQWKLVNISDDRWDYDNLEPLAPMSQIKIIPFKEKNGWKLQQKYNIGKGRKK